ncbi:hypothetical protein [Paractinoplanes durhamensis]|uniref:GCVT N-terminal domain-containing protein n=1 Tax=Paractinoplanes durhamensis TaxID=113563 RepID=A0ABQ3ZCK7_9ACTN|nr:hypothetical protein [Actinoplanes durhamensis]GIE07548.1 hypothetical protein Adu01nite_88980 [Actinoplanes durhamensis]
MLCRLSEDEFLYTAGSGNWLAWQFSKGTWNAEISDISPDQFIFGVQGPQSLHVLEKATGQSLRDIAFNHSRHAELAGIPLRVLRTGISGELGYELHGAAEHASTIWSAVAEAGAGFGLRLLGFGSQSVQHIEAGIATNGLDYMPAAGITPGAPTQFRHRPIGGSFVPAAFTDYFRKPGELGWGPRKAVPAHDFIGRAMSINVHATISLGVIAPGHATPGTEVTVLWGRPGTPQREIRATVTALPFKPDHRRTDVTRL